MSQVGRYQLTRRLGQGGMAEVLEAVAEGEGGFRRRVAIKRILPELASDPACARMFLDEARIASHVHHANVISVLDYGVVEGVPFQVLELVEGLDLERLLRRADTCQTPLPVGLALYIVVQVAYGLHSAHEACDDAGRQLGIVHRDVSTSNVLVSWDGHVKLGDFGIALAENRLERTVGTGVKGKLEYMSPEQASRGRVDRRTDIFALGCLLHRMLSGASPLLDVSPLVLLAHDAQLTLAASLDPGVAAVIRKALRSASCERHASALELASALGELVPGHLSEEPTGALRRFMEKLRDDHAARVPKPGVLDALLNVEMVLADHGLAGDARSFRLEGHATVGTRADEPSAEPASAVAPPARPSHTVWVLLGALLLLPVTVWVVWRSVQSAADQRRSPAPVSAATVPAPPVSALPSPPTTNSSPLILPPQPSAGELPGAQGGQNVRARRAPNLKARASWPAPSPAAPATAYGTLLVGGSGAQRAEIRVDGQSHGFAPKRLELRVGEHQVVLLRSDGSQVGPLVVRVAEEHTQTAPARLMVP